MSITVGFVAELLQTFLLSRFLFRLLFLLLFSLSSPSPYPLLSSALSSIPSFLPSYIISIPLTSSGRNCETLRLQNGIFMVSFLNNNSHCIVLNNAFCVGDSNDSFSGLHVPVFPGLCLRAGSHMSCGTNITSIKR